MNDSKGTIEIDAEVNNDKLLGCLKEAEVTTGLV